MLLFYHFLQILWRPSCSCKPETDMFGLWVVPFETCIIIAFFYNETFTPKILQTEEMLILINLTD